MPAACPDWSHPESDSKLPDVVLGMSGISRFIEKRATSYIVNQGTIRNWHKTLFERVVPLTYYAGNYRSNNPSRPCLASPVHIGAHYGSDFNIVEAEMDAYSALLATYITQTDTVLAMQASFAKKITASLQLTAWAVGRFIQIHPFLNGNGRISRLLANYFFVRYGLGMIPFKTIARPPGNYEAAMNSCMAGDFNGLFQYFILMHATNLNILPA